MSVSRRAGEIKPFYVMEAVRAAAAREAAGREVFHLEVGQPATKAPALVRAAAHAAIDDDQLGYTMAKGIPELRQRIVSWYLDQYDVVVDPERIIITPGASGSCIIAFLSLFEPGARVGVLEPGYPCYRNDLSVLDIDVVDIPIGPDTGFRPTPDLLDQHLPLDGLVIASPSNPTGTVLDREQLAAVVEWAGHNDVSLIVDEIYHGITFGDVSTPSALEFAGDGASTSAGTPNTSAATSPAQITVFNSFSKYWSMTGWRLGWAVVPPGTADAFERVMANLLISAPTISQIAGVAAFDSIEECDANVERYASNRTIILDGLRAAGIDQIAPPDGAFYVWADIAHLLDPQPADPHLANEVATAGTANATPTAEEQPITNSLELCARWLDEIGVAVTPGIDFDPVRGDRFIRFSYAGDGDEIAEAMRRVAEWTAARITGGSTPSGGAS